MNKRISYRFGKYSRPFLDPKKPRYASTRSTQEKFGGKAHVTIVSYNIHLSKRIPKAIKLMTDNKIIADADVICLQEMTLEGVKEIAKKINYNYVYYPAARHRVHRKDLGNAIFTKWRIVSDKKVVLTHSDLEKSRRIAVAATIAIGKKKLTVISVHKEVFLHIDHRKHQVKSIVQAIHPRTKYCVIAGDFNTFRKKTLKATLESFKESNFHLATGKIGWTYKHWYLLNKKSTLDHIFVKGMVVKNAGKISNRKPSDHIPIWTKLSFDK